MFILQKLKDKGLVTVVMCFLSFSVSIAQTTLPPPANGIIKGIIIDSTHQDVLGNVTISVQETVSQKFIKYAISNENGFFKIKGLPLQQYQFIISCIGYKTKIVNCPPFTSTVMDLGKITLVASAIQLKEVRVVVKQQLIEQDFDKLIYHVDQDPEKEILSVLEMFRKTPLLSIDADDNLQMNGSSNYQILINGKRSSLFASGSSDIFKSMRASAVKTIEVITNPSARYEADGIGGIINIITHKKNITGYNGSVNISGENPLAYNISSYGTIKSGKIGLSNQVVTNSQKSAVNINNFFREDKYRKSKLQQTGESRNNNSSQYVNGDISYDMNALDVMTINYNINKSHGAANFKQQVALLDAGNKLTSAYQRLNANTTTGYGFDIGIDYQKSFKKSNNQLLTVSYNLNNSTNTSKADYTLVSVLNYSNQASNTNYQDGTREQSFQVDYVQPLKQQTMELGIKSTFRSNGSDYSYSNLDLISGVFVRDTSLSNNFNYRQNIHALYTTFNWKMGHWALKTGIRIEKTTDDANFKSSGTIVSRNYVNFIPNIMLSRRLKSANMLRLSYMQRLERPGLYYLNPYVDLTDPQNISYGNPKVRPAIGHTFNLSYNVLIKQSFLTFNLLHTFINNSIQQYTVLVDSVGHTTFGNIGRHRSSHISINGNTRLFKKITININTSVRHIKYTNTINNNEQNRKGFAFNVFSSASYRLKKDWCVNSDLSYNSPNISTQGKTAGFTKSSISANKQFLKDKKAMMSMSVINPFQSKRHLFTEANDPAFYQLQESWVLTRRFIMSFNYRFGKVQR
ncbi:MAG TPA: outer membrane beta-barrel family protein [Niastella sp.]